MKRRAFVASVAAAGASLATSPSILAQTDADPATPRDETTDTTPQTGYAPVNGLQMYYEIHGTGEPLVLLHGAFGTIDLWGPLLERLAAERQVIAVELQGHGRTADIDRPLRYEQMADDTAALLQQLGIDSADIYGYSMGANTALQVAIRHPRLVRKLAVASAFFRPDGMYPEVLEGIKTITPEAFAGSPPYENYARLAPHPDDWPTLIAKEVEMELAFTGWPAAEIQAINAPTLVIIGDADVVRPEHAVEMLRLLGGGVAGDFAGLPPSQLAVLPGSTHVGVIFRTDWLVSMLTEFLNAPSPEERACTTGPTARGRRRERRPAPCQSVMRRIGDGPSAPRGDHGP